MSKKDETKEEIIEEVQEDATNDYETPEETVILEAVWSGDPSYDVVRNALTKTGSLHSSPKTTYQAVFQYRNRTAATVEVRLVFTATKHNGYNNYCQNFEFYTVDKNGHGTNSNPGTGAVVLAWANSWPEGYSEITKESPWVSITLDTAGTTEIYLHIGYWQSKYNGEYVNSVLSENVTISIPAYN